MPLNLAVLRCRAVGCDDVVGSSAREDQCGVCDGDGSSCAGELFRWRDTGHFSPCDKSCGPNSIRVSVSVCVNIHTERVVPERMCADRARPRPQIRRCEHIVCPSNSHLTPQLRHQWLAADWSDCSTTCGTGEQRREVFCVERVEKDVDRRVDDVQHCWQSQKPVEMRKCNFKMALRLKVSANGALRIFHAGLSDAGVYACRTADGRAQGNVTLRFKPASEGEKRPPAQSADNRTKQQRKGLELLQRVRDSLHRLGDRAVLQRLASVNDPAQIRVDFSVSSWADCHQAQCGQGEGVQVRLLKCQLHLRASARAGAVLLQLQALRQPNKKRMSGHLCPNNANSLSHSTILSAVDRVRPHLRVSPIFTSSSLNALCGGKELFFKCENLQKTGSFKSRGAMNAVLCALEGNANLRGVITHSSGNHGQALAWAASQKGLRCVVVVPKNTPDTKLDAIRSYGAELIQCEPSMESRRARRTPRGNSRMRVATHAGPCDTADDRSNGRENEQTPPISPSSAAFRRLCEDQSRFCDILRLFRTCEQAHVRARCCFSCRRFGNRTKNV
uniref:Serine racemase n=1 Tax=Globodera pallida TaxID=36090 RepID=A0A183BNU2_GLOPA